MHAHIKWTVGERLALLDEGRWKIVAVAQRVRDGINVSDDDGAQCFFSQKQLRQMFGGGKLRRIRDIGSVSVSKAKQMNASICALPQSERDEARRICAYVREWLRRGGRGRATKSLLEDIIASISKAINDKNPPSWRTLSAKLQHVKDGRFDVRAMIGNPSGRGNRTVRFGKFEPILNTLIREKILNPQPMKTDDMVSELKSELALWNATQGVADRVDLELGFRTVQRRVARICKFEKLAAWEGSKEAASRLGPVGKAPPSRFPMDCIEIDHTPVDVEVVHPDTGKPIGSPILTAAIDRYSRLVVGWHIGFEEPSYKTVMLCLRNVMFPKDALLEAYDLEPDALPYCGTPWGVMVDNGPEFHSASFDDSLSQLSVDIRYARTATGGDKGTIERFFRTVTYALFHTLPGAKLPGRDSTSHYDPKTNAVLTVAKLRRLFIHWLVKEYSNRFHRGIRNTPLVKFCQGTAKHPVQMPHDVADLDVLLLPAEARTLQRSGIEMFGTHYGQRHPELAALLKHINKPKDCVIKFDPNDIGSIYLLDWRTQKYIKLDCNQDTGFWGKTVREYEVDRELALSKKKASDKLYAGAVRASALERMENVRQLVENGKAKGRKIARLSDADTDVPNTVKQKRAQAAMPAKVISLAVPSRSVQGSGTRVKFTVNSR